MDPTFPPGSRLRYWVYADRHERQLIAAFAVEGDARHFLHLHCPCSGMLVERSDAASYSTNSLES